MFVGREQINMGMPATYLTNMVAPGAIVSDLTPEIQSTICYQHNRHPTLSQSPQLHPTLLTFYLYNYNVILPWNGGRVPV